MKASVYKINNEGQLSLDLLKANDIQPCALMTTGLDQEGNQLLVTYDSQAPSISSYQILLNGELKFLTTSAVTETYDKLSYISIGGSPFIIAYEQGSGIFQYYRLTKEGAAVAAYKYQRTYGLTTNGFTTIEPFFYRDGIYLLGYNTNEGTSAIYQISVPSTSPLTMTEIWRKQWAQGWEKFALFKMAGENLFLKSNQKYNNVNIDHFVDDPAQGSHPVGSHLDLSQDLNIVRAFNVSHDPYFLTYKNNGDCTLNRFHGDCQGWETVLLTSLPAGISLIASSEFDGETLIITC